MAEDIAVSKDEMRSRLKEIRNAIPEETRWEIDGEIVSRVCELDAYKNAEVVFTYLSFGSEVETRGIIQQAWGDGKVVALPRCVPGTRDMEWYKIASLEGLEKASNGVWEPGENEQNFIQPSKTSHALAIVPGLSFDCLGYRLGYGGGYYDVFLSEFLGISVGLCRESTFSEDSLRLDSFDVSADIVVTEKRISGIAGLGKELD